MKKLLMTGFLFLMSATLYAMESIHVKSGALNSFSVMAYFNKNPVSIPLGVWDPQITKLNDPQPISFSLYVFRPTYKFVVDIPLENATYLVTNLNMSDARCYYNLIFDLDGATISKVRAEPCTVAPDPSCDMSRLDFTVLGDVIKVNYTS